MAERAARNPDAYARSSATIRHSADQIRDTQPSPRTNAAATARPGGNPAYVAAVLRGEMQRLAQAPEGTRNDTLHRVACRVFELVKGGHADTEAARNELERIASAIGLTPNEIRATLRSAWRRASPRPIPTPNGAA
ncbi:primase alpha helix C-terminal domain-containing protein [Mycobacterium marinum]|uniref:primase alpha helix C-terminal domain-containing protein n=1 Tax=Mycobacterium marinum TaxID=1781 RepID=UPI002358E799|nr:primase alpha helix C-terminal domain-containing protein [Mycobacterium marinum]MDC8980688.1 primase alpha helix C-terminal domain-containing protein [Mycobacterium marinum]MDC8997886.1 primase alpha helix C-terminal domain-containing protein [Mycobacterium marinum]MDC9008626.1 primase alpha helix C-terminal domain-containing protein [Mycobacterium marinum]